MPACFPTTTSSPTRLHQGGRGYRRTGLAHAARARIRQADRFQIRRHEEHRPAAGPARSPRRNSCSASSPTRRRGRISTSPAPAWTRRRPTSTRAGVRAGASGCSTGWWRTITRSNGAANREGHDRDSVLPPAAPAARRRADAAAGEIARARLAGDRAGRLRGAHRGARRASVDLSRRRLPAARHLARAGGGGAAGAADGRPTTIRTAPMCAF